jgi:hypothetical protein
MRRCYLIHLKKISISVAFVERVDDCGEQGEVVGEGDKVLAGVRGEKADAARVTKKAPAKWIH